LSQHEGAGLGDDGIVSPAPDLRRFVPALALRQLTGENAGETYQTIDVGNGRGYGLGIMKQETPWGNLWGYAGNSTGFSGAMWFMSEPEFTLVLLSNDEEAQEKLDQLVLDIMEITLSERE
jgi:CubicO group peptidase (beta-lactamase class C family)